MRATRTGTILGMMLAASVAVAMPAYLNDFTTNYKLSKDSALKKANCGLCHQGMVTTKFNPYGQDLKKVMEELKTKKLTPEVLKKVELLDSDKDGAKNIDEIKAGTFPGDVKSCPPAKADS